MINPTLKLTSIAVGVGGIATGAAVGVYYALNKPTKIKDILGTKLLGFNEDYSQKWMARAIKLAKVKEGLSETLQNAKENEGDESGFKIMQWCQKNVNNKFISESDPAFLEVQEYCTLNIKDNPSAVLEENWNNKQKNNEKLINIAEASELSEAMIGVKAKLTSKDENALKDWCTEAYEKPFKGFNDQVYLDVMKYCEEVK